MLDLEAVFPVTVIDPGQVDLATRRGTGGQSSGSRRYSGGRGGTGDIRVTRIAAGIVGFYPVVVSRGWVQPHVGIAGRARRGRADLDEANTIDTIGCTLNREA